MTRKTIILMEDDQHLREFCSLILEQEGFQVVQAENSRHIMELIAEHRPALIITDLIMPDYEGIEAIFKILGSYQLPIIAMSVNELYLSMVKSEVDATLSKPIDAQTLVATVLEILKKQQPEQGKA